jgi:SH3-like domain-containing protein
VTFDPRSLLDQRRRFMGREGAALLRAVVLVAIIAATGLAVARARAAEGPSGLPLPRFVTTRSTPVNVRVGPGIKYEVAWVYLKAGTPVEIIQEFDTWRKIRDVDGSEGWLHQNLLQGSRAGFVGPWLPPGEQVALRQSRSEDAGVRAWLTPNLRVEIADCDGTWCEVSATSHPKEGSPRTYRGFIEEIDLWGVYKDEKFD